MAEQNSITNFSSFLECPNVKLEGGIIDGVTIGGITPDDATFLSMTASSVTISGGTIDDVSIGSLVPADGDFTSLSSSSVTFTGGTVDGVVIGGTTPSDGTFSTLTIDGAFTFPTTDGSANQVLTTDGAGVVSWQNSSDSAYEEVTSATKTMESNTAYGANLPAGITFTLPATSPAGSVISITGMQGIWSITQGASQAIRVGDSTTTTGVTGSITCDHYGDCIQMRCIVADLVWRVEYILGNLTLA